jgi:photosystem II stability/assembly factor-like uncharacterized protein
MSKKIFLFLVSVGLLSPGIIQAQWRVEKCPTRNNLNAISLFSSKSSWIVGDKGTILYKEGNTWKEYQKPTSENLYSIFMLKDDNGWAVGAKGTILHFDGQNWKPILSQTKKDLFSVYFKDSENGIVVGESGTIMTYRNGNWTSIGKGIRGDLFTVFFQNDDAWIGGGLECVRFPIMKMATREGTAQINNFDFFASIHDIFFLDSYNGWAVGSPSTLLHFDGTSWEKQIIDDKFSSLKSVFFSDNSNGISVGYGGTILVFSGDTWAKEYSLSTKTLRAAAIVDNSYYAVGDSGTIISKTRFTGKQVSTTPEEKSEKIELFPNPCDEILNIKFNVSNNQTIVKLSITNSSGQIIIQKTVNAWNGSLTYTLGTSVLKNGLYNLQITSGNKTTIAKFIIMH